MIILSASNLAVNFGAQTLFEGISFDVQEGDKIGLIGVNGCGKTTLFKLIMGIMKPDSGSVHMSKLLELGYMVQHVSHNSVNNVYEEALEVFNEVMELEKDIAANNAFLELNKNLNNDELEPYIKKQSAHNEKFERLGGYTYKSRTRATLLGLGFNETMLDMPVSALSGGEKAKVLLARILLSGANLLLLDEPTNHLDIKSVQWLEEYLKTFAGALVVISHDRYFLDKVTTRTFEVENGKMRTYMGNYSTFMQKKQQEQEIITHHYKTTKREIERLEGIVTQQRRWNREKNIKTAESKLKQIARLEADLQAPDKEVDSVKFSLSPKYESGDDVIMAKGLKKSFSHKELFSNTDMDIKKNERVFLLGANGCGKTTLLKILLGQMNADSGIYNIGVNVNIGYYDQTQSSLIYTKTVLEQVHDVYPVMTVTEVRNALARFLFKGEDAFKPISELSGGERARVLLLILMLSGANLLLLDEPTNHLDIASREALEEALLSYGGTMLIISHDRYFINKLASRVLLLTDSGTQEFLGDYDYYIDKMAQAIEQKKDKAESVPLKQYHLDKEKKAHYRRLTGKLQRLEKEYEAMQQKSDELEALLCSQEVACDYARATEVTKALESAKEECDLAYLEWAGLLEDLENDEGYLEFKQGQAGSL